MLTLRTNTAINSALQAFDSGARSRATWMERLASGQRINSGGDDAAGLAMSESLDSRLRSEDVLRRNILQGFDVLSIADGGLSEITDGVHRLRELALRSLADTVSDEQRALIQVEYDELLDAVAKTAKTTTYDGIRLLSKPHVDIAFLIDTSSSMNNEIAALKSSINDFKQDLADAGYSARFALVEVNAGRDPGDGTWTKLDVGLSGFASVLNGLTTTGGAMDPYSAMWNASGVSDTPGVHEPDALTWRTGTERRLIYLTDTGREADLIPGAETEADVGAALASDDYVVDVIANPTHFNQFDGITTATGGATHDLGTDGAGIAAALADISTKLTGGASNGSSSLDLQVGLDGEAEDRITVDLPVDSSPLSLGIFGTSATTKAEAADALDALDSALEQIATTRAGLGAAQNRLEVALRNLDTSRIADAQTESRIRDLDVAEGTTQATKSEIQSQLAISVLAQAKSLHRELALALVSSNR